MALRKLTRKSQFKFGQYADCTVQNILNLKSEYVAWVYFNCSNIDFFEDILDELKIVGKYIIEKPSTNKDLFYDYQSQFKRDLTDLERMARFQRKKGEKKRKKAREIARNINYQGNRDRFTHSVNTTK